MSAVVRIRSKILEEMIGCARSQPDIECCGLLAGIESVITKIFPTQNALASATAYEIAPADLFRLFQRMREEHLEHLGIYHSHPAGKNIPSPTDIKQALYPDHAYFILSPLPEDPLPIRAFSIRDQEVEELRIEALA